MTELHAAAHNFGIEKRTPPPARTISAVEMRCVLDNLAGAMTALAGPLLGNLPPVLAARAELRRAYDTLLIAAIGPLDVIPEAPVKEAAE
jgi:hypothetical protein